MKELINYIFCTNEAELTFDVFGSLCKIGLKLRGMRPELQAPRLKLRGMYREFFIWRGNFFTSIGNRTVISIDSKQLKKININFYTNAMAKQHILDRIVKFDLTQERLQED